MSGRGRGRRPRKRPAAAATAQTATRKTRRAVNEELEDVELVNLEDGQNEDQRKGNEKTKAGHRSNNGKQEIDFEEIFKNFCQKVGQDEEKMGDYASSGIEFLSTSDDDLTIHVPPKLKTHIQNLQYTYIALLLQGSLVLSRICSGGNLVVGATGCIEAQPQSQSDKYFIKSIEEWTDSFIIYSAILTEKHPDLGQELLAYMASIRDAGKYLPMWAWQEYDEQYRLRQSMPHKRQPWSLPNDKLWSKIRVKLSGTGPSAPAASTHESVTNTSGFTCNDFNYGRCIRNVCRFKHACAACNSPTHGKMRCIHLGNGGGPQLQNTPFSNPSPFRGRYPSRRPRPYSRGSRGTRHMY